MKTLTQIKAWLNTPSHIKCTLADITELGNLSGGTLNLSSVAYTDSSTAYDACIIGGLNFSEQLNLDGAASLSFGAIDLVNTYGINDRFLTYIWNRRPIKIYLGDPSWPKSDFVLIFDGLVQDLTTNGEGELTLSLFDKLQWLNDSLTETTLYNTSYSEKQKVVNGITTKNETILPITFGECFNVQPLFVDNGTTGNTGNVYMVHNGLVDNIVEVRDNGVPITVTTNLSTGTFALNTTPFGTITCDVLGDASSSYSNTIPGIITKICTSSNYGTIATNRFTSSDLNLGTDTRAVGVYINSKTNMLQICNQLAQSINASLISPSITVNYQTDQISASKLRLVELKVPSSADAVVELNDDYMVVGSLAITEIFPVKPYVKLGYCKNFTVQQTVASGINPASKFDEEYWYITGENPTNKTLYRDAGTVEETPTLLITSANANTEATKRLTLWEVPRKLITATYLPHHLFTQLGDTVTIKSSRFGLDAGKPGIVYSIGRDWITGLVQIGVLV